MSVNFSVMHHCLMASSTVVVNIKTCSRSLKATYNMNYTCRIDALINVLTCDYNNCAINAITKINRSTALVIIIITFIIIITAAASLVDSFWKKLLMAHSWKSVMIQENQTFISEMAVLIYIACGRQQDGKLGHNRAYTACRLTEQVLHDDATNTS